MIRNLTAMALTACVAASLCMSVAVAQPASQAPTLQPPVEPMQPQPVQQGEMNESQPIGLAPVGDPIQRVMDAKLMAGYPDGKFHPEGTINRAQLAVIIDKTFNLANRAPKFTSPFTMNDIPQSHWAYPAIQNVLTRGVMEGYKPGYFYPDQPVTRAEALSIFAQAYGVQQYDDKAVSEILSPYPDARQVPDWAEKSLATSLKYGFVNTEQQSNRIRPMQPMTRGDMAYALSQYLERLNPSDGHGVPKS